MLTYDESSGSVERGPETMLAEASSPLWQNGQRRLQPGKKTAVATRPGKLTRLVFKRPTFIVY